MLETLTLQYGKSSKDVVHEARLFGFLPCTKSTCTKHACTSGVADNAVLGLSDPGIMGGFQFVCGHPHRLSHLSLLPYRSILSKAMIMSLTALGMTACGYTLLNV